MLSAFYPTVNADSMLPKPIRPAFHHQIFHLHGFCFSLCHPARICIGCCRCSCCCLCSSFCHPAGICICRCRCSCSSRCTCRCRCTCLRSSPVILQTPGGPSMPAFGAWVGNRTTPDPPTTTSSSRATSRQHHQSRPNNREADKSASEGRRADEAETTTLSHPIKLIASNKPHALNP